MTSAPGLDEPSPSGHESETAARGRSTGGSDDVEAAVIRSEEHLETSTVRVATTRVRMRKQIVTETHTLTVQVSREEFIQEQEPITDSDTQQATPMPDAPGSQEIEIILHEQRPVITMETVAVERIRVRTRTVTEEHTIAETIGKEQIELHHDPVVQATIPAQSGRQAS